MTRKPSRLALIALLLALTLGLSGCGLVVKDPAVDARQVIVEVNGETIEKAEFARILDNAYNREYQQQSLMVQYGLAQRINVDRAALLTSTLDAAAQDKLLHQKSRELGLDAFTDEENARIDADAEESLQGIIGQVKEYFFAGSTLPEQELDAAAEAKAEELGYTREVMRESAREALLHEKLEAWPGRELSITDEELKAEYDARVEAAKAAYAESPSQYGEDVNGGTPVYYAPAGYRMVKHALIRLEEADSQALAALDAELRTLKTALDTAQAAADAHLALAQNETRTEAEQARLDEQLAALTADEVIEYGKLARADAPDEAATARREELRARVTVYQALAEAQAAYDAKQAERKAAEDAAFAKILPRAQEVQALLSAPDADADALIKEYNEDPGMPEAGYAVSADTTAFVPEFTAAAMALTAPGGVSEPVRTNYGYHVLVYAADVPEGPAAQETVGAAILEELLTQRREAAYTAALQEWKAAADIKLYPERMSD